MESRNLIREIDLGGSALSPSLSQRLGPFWRLLPTSLKRLRSVIASVILLIGLQMALECDKAMGDQLYNPFTKKWETVPANSELQYSPRRRTWTYQPQGSQEEYNPRNRKWEWSSGHGNEGDDNDCR